MAVLALVLVVVSLPAVSMAAYPCRSWGFDVWGAYSVDPIDVTFTLEQLPTEATVVLGVEAEDIDDEFQINVVHLNGHELGRLVGRGDNRARTEFTVSTSWLQTENHLHIDVIEGILLLRLVTLGDGCGVQPQEIPYGYLAGVAVKAEVVGDKVTLTALPNQPFWYGFFANPCFQGVTAPDGTFGFRTEVGTQYGFKDAKCLLVDYKRLATGSATLSRVEYEALLKASVESGTRSNVIVVMP